VGQIRVTQAGDNLVKSLCALGNSLRNWAIRRKIVFGDLGAARILFTGADEGLNGGKSGGNKDHKARSSIGPKRKKAEERLRSLGSYNIIITDECTTAEGRTLG